MWFILSTFASLFWGLTYAIDGQLLKHISVPTMIATHALIISVVAAILSYSSGTFKDDLTMIAASRSLLFLVLAGMCTFVVAELLIWYSIAESNASLAALIEISYPIFTILFAYLLFKEVQISIMSAVGGLFIFIGVTIIYWFNS
ncbi:MAG: EamA family transporter [Candidatus Pacebacteria bacterium]|nr:EamA family transporter [Candidatus Paceibacterota bacterium]